MLTPSIKLLHLIAAGYLFHHHCFVAGYRSWRWEASHNSRLPDHVIESKMELSLLNCLSLCGAVSGCRTINHRLQDGLCELNEADDRWQDITGQVSHPQFGYYRRLIPTSPGSVDTAQKDQLCHEDHILLDNTCLELQPYDKLNFSSADRACEHKYGRLAVLDTAALLNLLNIMPPLGGNGGRYYVDMVRRSSDGVMVWGATDTPVDLGSPPWRTGQPDNYDGGSEPEDCGTVEAEVTGFDPDGNFIYGFSFLDIPCNLGDRGYICQYDPYVHLTW